MKILHRNIVVLLLVLLLSCAENPPALQWEMKNVHDTFCPDGEETRECAVVDLNYPLFRGHLSDSLNRLILNTLCLNLVNDSPCQRIDAIAQDFINEYKAFLAEMPGDFAGWELKQQINVIYDSDKVLAMLHKFYAYTGGAHGMPGEYYITIEKDSGHLLVLDDILDSTKRSEFLAVARKQFYQQRDIPAGQTLTDAGYWFDKDEFFLPDNFTINDDGLLFLYNPYEIASYADGMIELSLAYSEIQSFLNMERIR